MLKGLVFTALFVVLGFVPSALAQEVREVVEGQTSILPGAPAAVYTNRGGIFFNLLGKLPPEVARTLGEVLSTGNGVGVTFYCKVEIVTDSNSGTIFTIPYGTILECQEPDKK